MTSFDSLLDQCTCFRTRQTAHLSRSSPGVGFHPNHHPNQGFIRVYVICCNCVNWFQNRTVLYIIAHYLQPSPTSSPVSRTTEILDLQGFPIFLCAEIPKPYPNDTQSSHVFNEGLHPVCRFAAHGVRHVTVAIQRERRGIVSHVFLQGFDVIPCPKAVHREGMAQIVHPMVLL